MPSTTQRKRRSSSLSNSNSTISKVSSKHERQQENISRIDDFLNEYGNDSVPSPIDTASLSGGVNTVDILSANSFLRSKKNRNHKKMLMSQSTTQLPPYLAFDVPTTTEPSPATNFSFNDGFSALQSRPSPFASSARNRSSSYTTPPNDNPLKAPTSIAQATLDKDADFMVKHRKKQIEVSWAASPFFTIKLKLTLTLTLTLNCRTKRPPCFSRGGDA